MAVFFRNKILPTLQHGYRGQTELLELSIESSQPVVDHTRCVSVSVSTWYSVFVALSDDFEKAEELCDKEEAGRRVEPDERVVLLNLHDGNEKRQAQPGVVHHLQRHGECAHTGKLRATAGWCATKMCSAGLLEHSPNIFFKTQENPT